MTTPQGTVDHQVASFWLIMIMYHGLEQLCLWDGQTTILYMRAGCESLWNRHVFSIFIDDYLIFPLKNTMFPLTNTIFPLKNTRIHHFVRTCSSIGYLGSAGGSTMNLSQPARKVIWLGKPKTMWKSDGFLFGTWSTNGGVWLHIYIIYAGWKDDIYIYL